jgi:hypothetical protein
MPVTSLGRRRDLWLLTSHVLAQLDIRMAAYRDLPARDFAEVVHSTLRSMLSEMPNASEHHDAMKWAACLVWVDSHQRKRPLAEEEKEE